MNYGASYYNVPYLECTNLENVNDGKGQET